TKCVAQSPLAQKRLLRCRLAVRGFVWSGRNNRATTAQADGAFRNMTFRISVDTGGTFTDVVIADGSGIRAIGKALTTPKRIFDGMRAAIEVAAQEINLDGKTLLSQSDMLIYGTTRATNAVVTKSTAKTAFLTTRGFRDVLVLKEGGKYDPHDYSYDYPPPYIPRRYTFEIDERVDAQGNVVHPLDGNQAQAVISTLAQRRFEAVSVCSRRRSAASSSRNCRAFPLPFPTNSFPSCANTGARRRRRSMRR